MYVKNKMNVKENAVKSLSDELAVFVCMPVNAACV